MMKVVIIGRTKMLYGTALMLKEHGCELVGVITAKAAPEYDYREGDFERLATSLDIPYFFTTSLENPKIVEFLEKVKADIGVSVNWVGLVRETTISRFKHGILNAHLGDIPRFRGNACSNWAIINGEKEIVLSIHLMEGGQLDCGRVLVQDRMSIGDDTYIGDVHRWANEMIPCSFVNAIDLIKKDPNSMLKYADPCAAESFRCYPRCPGDGLIDWKHQAIEIHRLIRASSEPFAGAFTFHQVKRLTIWRASLINDHEKYCAVPGQVCSIDKTNGTVTVITGLGKLMLNEVSFEEPTHIVPAAIIRSTRTRLGI